MDNLTESLIGLDSDIPAIPSTEGKPSELANSLDPIIDEKPNEKKSDEVQESNAGDSDEITSDLDKTQTSIDLEIHDKGDVLVSTDRVEEAKLSLSEFLKVGDDPPQNAVILNEFVDNLESERDKMIEDLISTTTSTVKDELLTYTTHFDVLNVEKAENKFDTNTDVSMDIDTSLKNEGNLDENKVDELNVEDKIKELLVDENDDSKTEEGQIDNEMKIPETLKANIDSKDTSKDDIDTLLSTLMPDLESSTKPDDTVTAPKKQSIQYLRDVLDKPEERGKKRKISTDSETDEKATKKVKVLSILPEVTLTKVGSKKRKLNFDDLMSNLTKIKLPNSFWKVRISAGSNPFSIVEFHDKEKLLRSVKFLKEDFQYKVLFNNLPVELLGAPEKVHSLDDVSVLLNIVNKLIKNDPVVHYL